jgi:hypothetical protein
MLEFGIFIFLVLIVPVKFIISSISSISSSLNVGNYFTGLIIPNLYEGLI